MKCKNVNIRYRFKNINKNSRHHKIYLKWLYVILIQISVIIASVSFLKRNTDVSRIDNLFI